MISVLFVSGALWLLTDRLKHTATGEMWSRMSASLLMLHGAAAMLMLVRLYYAGAESARDWASDLHIGVGLALPALLALHIVRGRRRRHAVELERSPSIDSRSTVRPPAPSQS